ncbi:O-antigen ligase family protein [Clostridium tertium]|uniref:O-antigen ligase family protein n=1 Tax=Clostridium tertium TaxID=1559 RepID=UPI00232CC3A8|nr:O-antigen ligase family protein [Clostridium tertium]MDB1921724.1 O-antigen ligase family protein [Clostridium tertium]MDB1924927.1 O-antigen ligase family protein [Clostridium tertium]MDB1929566.1 O-antigen ligase family protein [Clostridium tertium]
MNTWSSLYSLVTNKLYFRISYLLLNLLIITMLRFIPGVHIINKFIICWGLLLICSNIFEIIIKKQLPSKIEILIYLFLGSTLLFTVLKYPTIDNIKVIIINFIILTIFFDIDIDKNFEQLKKELNLFLYIYIIFTFFSSIISLAIIFSRRTIWISETLNGEYLSYGLHSFFLNENSLGISATLALIITFYLLVNAKEKIIYQFIFSLNIVIQLITLILSKSRSTYLALLSFIFILIFMYLKNNLFRFSLVLIAALSSISLFIIKKDSIDSFLTGRDVLWSLAFETITNNFISGVGFTNLTSILNENNLLTLGRLHNIYIEIGASNGILPLILFILILLSIYIFLFNKIDNLKNNKLMYIVLFALTISILSINLVESSLVYIISFISIIFWTVLSYIISILSKDKI